jgi:hypothetical protein
MRDPLYRIAREVTDEVLGPGTYAAVNRGNPDPQVREEVRMSEKTEAENVDPREHIDPDDPRYDGFRLREYWVATAVAPDNQEAPLFVVPQMASDFHLSPGPALAADERRLLHLREYAQWAADAHQCEVRIRHFVAEGDDEVYGT